MTETFGWLIYSQEPQVEYAYAELSARFGDGYEQVAPDGINNERQTWNIELWGHLQADDMAGVRSFLRLRKTRGESFFWTPPNEPAARFRCTKLSATDEREGYIRISCTFEQTFQP